jgi:hypothetical protein
LSEDSLSLEQSSIISSICFLCVMVFINVCIYHYYKVRKSNQHLRGYKMIVVGIIAVFSALTLFSDYALKFMMGY